MFTDFAAETTDSEERQNKILAAVGAQVVYTALMFANRVISSILLSSTTHRQLFGPITFHQSP